MIIDKDYYKNYTINYYQEHIEIIINLLPKNNYHKGKLYFDLISYFNINNTVIKYNDKIFTNKEDLKKFFKSF